MPTRSRLVLRSTFALGQVLQGLSATEERIKMVKEFLLLPLSRLVGFFGSQINGKINFSFFFSVCLGASNDIDKCLELAKETPKLARKSGHQLERFLLRRANQMVKEHEALSQEYCLLLVYELLYLWNALGACLKHSHTAIQIGKPIF